MSGEPGENARELSVARGAGLAFAAAPHRSRTAPQLARRPRIVLASADGLDNKVAAKKPRITPQTVGRWRTRFVVDGLQELYARNHF